MKKHLLLFFFVLAGKSFAQYPILNDSIKKPGIYKTFDEFKNNSPSIPLNYTILSKRNTLFTNWGKESINTYAVKMPIEESRAIGSVFGFCDGFYFYVLAKELMLFPESVHKFLFFRVDGMGKYPYLDMVIQVNYTMASNNGFDMISVPTIDLAVINFETGEIKKLTVKMMKEILADKPQLLERFKNQ